MRSWSTRLSKIPLEADMFKLGLMTLKSAGKIAGIVAGTVVVWEGGRWVTRKVRKSREEADE